MHILDTIVAIATGSSTSAIGIIRISGSKSFSIADKMFLAKNNKKVIDQKHKTVNYGQIVDLNEIIDEVLLTKFQSPNSYTGEDTVEISCHGSVIILNKIIQIAIKNGCRLAEPGEYTKRAFMNGKLDLSQAEAVADLIASKSEAARKVAINQLKGGFSSKLAQLRAKLVNFVSLIELELDFSEEDVEFADRSQLNTVIDEMRAELLKLIKSFSYGNAIKNGINVAIVGEPNVGKSTLLNRLLHEERAIVSEIAGTTRDTIEDTMSINGVLFRFIDTAGLRHTTDTIENLGIERAIEMVKKSEIVLYVIDAQQQTETTLYEGIKAHLENKKLIVVVNKIDKKHADFSSQMFRNYDIIDVSAKQDTNIDKLEKALIEASKIGSFDENDIIVSNLRHYEALQLTYEASERVVEALKSNVSGDFLSLDIREMLQFLGEITGEISNNEILGNIFKNFCIGK